MSGFSEFHSPAMISRKRIALSLFCVLLVFFLFGMRLFDITSRDAPGWLTPVVDAPMIQRGRILDARGELLATSIPTFSLFANPRHIRDPQDLAGRLSGIVEVPEERLAELFSSAKGFVWVRRQLTLEMREKIESLGLPGLAFRKEYQRVYPYGRLTAHIVGVTDIDGKGLSGIENSRDEILAGGEDVPLSIDIRFQMGVREELSGSVDYFSAIGGAAVVLDIETGEVKALVSLPDFEPRASGITSDQRFNRATLGVYELGSTMKLLTAAMAIEEGIPLSRRYAVGEPLRINRFAIKDYEQMSGSVSLAGMIRYSSNIAAARIGLELGADKQKDWLDRLSVTRRLPIGLPEAGRPLTPSTWRPVNVATVSFGHGLATSPLHLVTAVASTIGTGDLIVPSIVKGQGGRGERLFSESTVKAMRSLMRLVVTNGTGRRSEIAGYELGGKTGTADKAAARGYDRNRRISSFVGAFPMSNPRYAVYAMVDEPKGRRETHGFATGGWVAAPVVGRIVARIATLDAIPLHANTGIVDVKALLDLDKR